MGGRWEMEEATEGNEGNEGKRRKRGRGLTTDPSTVRQAHRGQALDRRTRKNAKGREKNKKRELHE
jgi:hypothetical protein